MHPKLEECNQCGSSNVTTHVDEKEVIAECNECGFSYKWDDKSVKWVPHVLV